jgi:DNA topoisomerase-6 subunit B
MGFARGGGSFSDWKVVRRSSFVASAVTKRKSKKKGGRTPKGRSSGSSKRDSKRKTKQAAETLPLFDQPRSTPAKPAERPADEPSPDRSGSPQGGKRTRQTAQSIGLKQREISISEFFAKNRHLLGFDSLPKALLTAVKEAVDNSLDACEEAGLLPDILVEIGEIAENRYRLVVEDSGPGIVKSQVPRIFGKLLYGSKFHVLKQSRGQQGIGISAAVMYAQLTTGKPVKVITRTGPRQQAHAYELQIDTKKNNPVIISDNTTNWERPHGIRVEMEILAAYKKGQRSVDAYLHQVAMANPHARFVYHSPKNPERVYERLTETLPEEPREIKPHPHGVELGVLLDMLKVTKSRNVKGFLETEFSRMSSRTSTEVLEAAGVAPKTSPKRITRDQAEAMIKAFTYAKIMKPPTNCLSPIGEELLTKSLEREVEADFIASITRPPAVYRGNPFQIEAAVAYGGTSLDAEDTVKLQRFANRAPLIYQQSACSITRSVIGTAWKSYGVSQARGALPTGPMLIVVHIASAWVPFTSESKEAIAHYPEIIKEIKLAVQECGRRLARFIRKGMRAKEEAKKRSYIEQYIPHIGIALQEILDFSDREEKKVINRLKTTLEKSRKH